MQYNLIIIGSGSVGAAAGYYARRAGLNVLMTDAHQPPHQEGSHHGSSRLIRHAYGEGENMFRWCCVPSSYGTNWQRSVAKPCLNAPASLTSAPPAPLSRQRRRQRPCVPA